MPQTGTFPRMLKLLQSPLRIVYLEEIPHIIVWLFYGLICVNFLSLVSCAYTANFFFNKYARRGAAAGVFVNAVSLFVGVVFMLMANRDGQGWNPANDVRFCTAVTPVTGLPFHENPLNFCTNDFLCPITLLPSELGINGNFKMTMAFVSVSLVSYLLIYLFTLAVQPDIDEYRASTAEERAAKIAQINSNLSDKTFYGTADEHQDYVNGLNSGKGQIVSVQSAMIPEITQSAGAPTAKQRNGRKS